MCPYLTKLHLTCAQFLLTELSLNQAFGPSPTDSNVNKDKYEQKRRKLGEFSNYSLT